MIVTLKELQMHINNNGITVEYQNGEHQHGTKKSPEVETYIALQKNYQSAIRILIDLAPEIQEASKLSQFLEMSK